MTPWSANDACGEPIRGMFGQGAGAPAELQPGQDLSQLLLDLRQLEAEVAQATPTVGGVATGEYGGNAGLPEVAQVVEIGGGPARHERIDGEAAVELEAGLLRLRIQRSYQELDAGEVRRR